MLINANRLPADWLADAPEKEMNNQLLLAAFELAANMTGTQSIY